MAEQHTASQQTILIRLTVNGHGHEVAVEPHETLIELIRDHLGLTGTKKSCDMQVCGACTVLLDGRPVSSCTLLAFEARNASLLTIEGMAQGGNPASNPGGVYRMQRVSMRVLHTRHDPHRQSAPGRTPTANQRRDQTLYAR